LFVRFAAVLLLIVPLQVAGSSFEKDFAVVFIDAATEANYGPIPLDRALLARALERLAVARARGVVLKFFLDLRGNGT
jgi:CHASE2 domain-containing sensor protein